jgi:hypothetical protein
MNVGRIRSIFATVIAAIWERFQYRIASGISVLLMLIAIAYVVLVMLATMKWLDARWFALTVPAAVIVAFPVLKGMSRFSRRITGE